MNKGQLQLCDWGSAFTFLLKAFLKMFKILYINV